MATLAETVTDVTDDRLAARNALVLAAAQALAGGNNTVIVATGGIVGTMLAPDPALATVPISFMAVGMWIGTLPVGILAKAFGRRFALQTGTIFGALSGLIACAAVLSELVRAFPGRHALRRSLRRGASILSLCGSRYRERAFPPAGDSLGARRRRGCGRDWAAARHSHQGRVAGVPVRRHLFGAIGLRRDRRRGADAAEASQAGRRFVHLPKGARLPR